MLGEKLRKLRESKGLLQRQVASQLEVDTAYVSKIESNEKPVSRGHLKKLAKLYNITLKDLETLWLADKLFDLAENEPMAIQAMKLAELEIMNKSKNSN